MYFSMSLIWCYCLVSYLLQAKDIIHEKIIPDTAIHKAARVVNKIIFSKFIFFELSSFQVERVWPTDMMNKKAKSFYSLFLSIADKLD